jgi:hypothetical protein
MTVSVRALLESFDALSETDRVEAAAEILRRVTSAEAELLEQVLVEAGDKLFTLLDSERPPNSERVLVAVS